MAGAKLGLRLVLLVLCGTSVVAQASLSASAYEKCSSMLGMTSWCQPMIRCSVFWSELTKYTNPLCYGGRNADGSLYRGACCPMVTSGHSQCHIFYLFLICFVYFLRV